MSIDVLHAIGHIHTVYPEKFGIPRQSGLANSARGVITFEAEYNNADCFRGLEEYSHIWLIWGFCANHHKKWTPTVRPPRLGGNERKGVFATRSPYRPNPIGLSSVRLIQTDLSDPSHPFLVVEGADLMDGTPIYDIKPYLPYTDSHPEAAQSFAKSGLSHRLTVHYEDDIFRRIPENFKRGILESLALDPRPSYQNDPERIYGMKYDRYNIRFRVLGNDLTICEIQIIQKQK